MADVLVTSGAVTVTVSTTPLIALTAVQEKATIWVKNSGAATATIEVAGAPDDSGSYTPVIFDSPSLMNDDATSPTGLAAGTHAQFTIPDNAPPYIRVRAITASGSTTVTADVIRQNKVRFRT